MKKLFLTSAVCMGIACPAFATVTSNSDTCNDTNLGTASGTANLEAIWTANTYSEPAGQYLLYSNGTISQHQTCPANSYCEGFTDETFADASMGIQSCATSDGDGEWTAGDYPYSDAGASDSYQCYDTATENCSTLNPYSDAHGTVNYANSSTSVRNYFEAQNVMLTPASCAVASLTCNTGYHSTGTNGALANYVNANTVFDEDHIRYKGLNSTNNYGNQTGLSAGEYEVKWMDGTTVHGMAKCSAKSGNNSSYTWSNDSSNWSATESELTGASGEAKYCWCDMTGYNVTNGSLQTVASPSWVFDYDYSSASICADLCANRCAGRVLGNSAFRGALFGDLGKNMACVANTIDIDWYNGNSLVESNQCTYDSTITLPTQPNKTGYTFNGWKIKASGNN